MKKLIVYCCIFFFFLYIDNVKAEEYANLEEEYLPGVYYSLHYQDGTIHTHQQAKFSMNGKTVYCLEPRKDAITGDYIVTSGIPETVMNETIKKQVEEYGYYGYDYPGHQTINFYLATQELIWEKIEAMEVNWYTRNYENGEIINIEWEKNEIKRLIEESKKKPSFFEQKISVTINQEIKLEDKNQVLQNYEMKEGGILEGNTLIFPKTDQIGAQRVYLSQNKYDYETTLLYQKEGSQSLSFLRLSYPLSLTYEIERVGGQIIIQKYGEQPFLQDNKYQYQKIPLENISFEICAKEDIKGYHNQLIYQKDQCIESIATDELGIAKTSWIPFGNYYVKETTIPTHHQENKTVYPFTMDSLLETLEIQNEWEKGKIIITKTGTEQEVIPNTVFEIYNEKMQLVGAGLTNEQGILMIENLPYGNYYIKEVQSNPKYYSIKEPIKMTVNQDVNEVTVVNKKKEELPKTSSSKDNGNILMSGLLFTLLYYIWKRK